MEKMDMPADMPIESRIVGKVIEQAQIKVEGFNFDARKHLLEYDDVLNKQRTAVYAKRETLLHERAPVQALYFLDMLWMSHLEDMESLRDSVRLRAYGQRDPLVEYRREAHMLYQQLLAQFDEWMAENEERLKAAAEAAKETAVPTASPLAIPAAPAVKQYEGTGRNDACPCGKKDAEGNPLKYKKCHGR